MLFEVDAIDERSGRISGPVEYDKLELVGQRPLLHPGGVAVANAAVNEDHTLHFRARLTPRGS
jgi:hypothetical protein